jgi:hypothetical protein
MVGHVLHSELYESEGQKWKSTGHFLTACVLLLCVQVYGLLDRSWDQFITFSQAYEAAGCKIAALAAAACKAAAAAALPAVKPPASPEPLDEVVADLQEQLLQLQQEKAQAVADATLQQRLRELKVWNADLRWENLQLQPEVPPQPAASAAAAAEVAEVVEAVKAPAEKQDRVVLFSGMTKKQLPAQKKGKKGGLPGKKQQRNLIWPYDEALDMLVRGRWH